MRFGQNRKAKYQEDERNTQIYTERERERERETNKAGQKIEWKEKFYSKWRHSVALMQSYSVTVWLKMAGNGGRLIKFIATNTDTFGQN